MTAYGIAHLRPAAVLAEEVFEYMERIQATLDPFGGKFLVHGNEIEVVEGEWPGALVMIGFPSLAVAREWYASAAYQEILHLRADHIPGDLILVDGCGPDHDSAAMAAELRAAQLTRPA
ncbi:DUF1330 domain-containing protein [Amycolatopsis keratiniphila]|uniref:DUF1330 domain-containing protein n=1 Tax=Amycolatopsis keratiniphila TaxID=129921 RepID=R4T071_9PSEU|nr:DUF1330 domain-containing protein [Amycolatopsis keratiniphila]AGM08235.1 hypothetical protein AORI_5652 [Amycolatopsis keratiniphila]